MAGNRLSRLETVGTSTTSRAFTYGYGNVLATVDGSSVSWNAFGETTTDHRGADIDRAGDGAEVGVTDSAGLPLYGFTRGPGGEAVEVEDLDVGGLRSFLWGPAEADFPVSTLDEGGADQAYLAIEGMVVGRLDGGSFVPMAQTAQGGMLLDGSDFLDAGLAFGEESAVAAGSPERRVWALLESLPGTAYKLPRRRLYDEETGRFTSQDPIGLAGGDHRFAYVNGDPLGAVDPSGLVGRPSSIAIETPPPIWALDYQGGSSPGWMRGAMTKNAIPDWMRNDTRGCDATDPFCIRADGAPPPETEEAQGEVDAGAEGPVSEVEFEPVLVTGGMLVPSEGMEVEEADGGGMMWSEAVADEMTEGDTGIVSDEGTFDTYNDNGGLDGGTPSPMDIGTGFQGLNQTMVDGVSLQYSAIPRVDVVGGRKELVAHATLRIIARPSGKSGGAFMDVGHSWAQIDYALPEGGTQRRVYSFAPVASPQINPLVEVPGMVETVYPLYGGERFIGFAMSSEQTAAVLAAAEQVVAEPPLYHGANSNCTDFTIKLASVAGFPVSTEGIDTPNSIVEAANNKVPRNGIYDPNNPDAWVLP